MAYKVDALPTLIPIGIRTENGVLTVEFDCSAWLDKWPDMVCSAEHTRPGEAASYPVACEHDGTTLRWLVSRADTELPGQGVIEVIGLSEGKRKLSGKAWTNIEETSTTTTGEVPAPMQPFVNQVLEAAARAEDAAKRAEDAADSSGGGGGGIGTVTSVNGVAPDDAGNVEIEIPKPPTKVSELDNDKGYITGYAETDPTVPNWAKAASKPSYTKSEVGLGNVDNVRQYSASNPPPTPTAQQVGADAEGTAAAKVGEHNTDDEAHSDIRTLISGLTQRLNALADSDDTTLDQLSEIVAYIKSNKSLIDGITTGKVSVSDIVNNLTTNVATKPLSAAQGVALKKLIDAIVVPTKVSTLENDSGYLDASALSGAVDAALVQAKESGEFDGEPGPPGTSGVHYGSEPPTGDETVWIDPDGEPSSYEEWTFTLADGSTVTKRVVVV